MCFCVVNAFAQIAISKPNLGFSQACASESFNSYNVTFSFSPEVALQPSNSFIVELSDNSGSFSNAVQVFTSAPGTVVISPATLTFSIPTTTSGENYKIRIKSTAPAATSSASDAFAAYYKIQDSPFSINNLIETAVYCSGGSYVLSIDNPGGENNDSPLQYPALSFKWYRETSATTSVFVASGESLLVSSPGTYFVETDYGTCTSNSFSNRVTVTEASSGNTDTTINSSLGNPYCSSNGPTTLSTIAANSYQWFKDGVQIPGATAQSYQTQEGGTFSVNINLGNCTASASIVLENSGFESSIDIDTQSSTMLPEGETRTVTVTTTAQNPVFEWYRNDVLLSGETTDTYLVTQAGNYRVSISQPSGCAAEKSFSFRITEPFPDVANIPNLVSPNGDNINDTWVLPLAYTSGSNTEITVYNAQGKVVLKTNDYQNNWPENELDISGVSPVYYYIIKPLNQKETKGVITIVR